MNKKAALGIFICVILFSVILVVLISPKKEADYKGKITSIHELETAEGQLTYYKIEINGEEYGFDKKIIILIDNNTIVQRRDKKEFTPNAFIVKDIIEVYYDASEANKNIIKAKKVVFIGH